MCFGTLAGCFLRKMAGVTRSSLICGSFVDLWHGWQRRRHMATMRKCVLLSRSLARQLYGMARFVKAEIRAEYVLPRCVWFRYCRLSITRFSSAFSCWEGGVFLHESTRSLWSTSLIVVHNYGLSRARAVFLEKRRLERIELMQIPLVGAVICA